MTKKQRALDDSRWSAEEIDVAYLLRTLPGCRRWFFTGQLPNHPTSNRSPIQRQPRIPVAVAVAPVTAAASAIAPITAAASAIAPVCAAVSAAVVAPSCNPVVALSPNTPLSFPVNESEEKTVPPRKKSSLQRKKEHRLNLIEDLTKTKAALTQELENLKRHYEELKDMNLKLKAKEQELINGSKSDYKTPNLETHEAVQIGQPHVSIKSLKSTAENEVQKQQQQQMQMANQNENFGTHNGNPTTSLQMTSNVDNNEGPLPFPDLNISIEESIDVESCQPLDESKAKKGID